MVLTVQQQLKERKKRTMKNQNVRYMLLLVLVIAGVVFTSGCSCTRVEPGYVGIKVNMYGDQKGVEDFPLQTGRVWYNPWTEEVYKFPTFLQSVVWTRTMTEGSPVDESITFNSTEGASINTDIAISYSFDGTKVPDIFVEFRQDAEQITDVYMRSQVRDTFSRIASKMKTVEIFGEKKQDLMQNVLNDLNERLEPRGFHFDMISIVGDMRADQTVMKSINAVIEATQKAIEAENKVRQVEAEALQHVAEAKGKAEAILLEAEATAEANRKIAESITPEVIAWQGVEKWDGILPFAGTAPFGVK